MRVFELFDFKRLFSFSQEINFSDLRRKFVKKEKEYVTPKLKMAALKHIKIPETKNWRFDLGNWPLKYGK